MLLQYIESVENIDVRSRGFNKVFFIFRHTESEPRHRLAYSTYVSVPFSNFALGE